MQKRIGRNEQIILNNALSRIHRFKVFRQHKGKGETFLNHLLIDYLRQYDLGVENRKIEVARMFGEQFRPECFLRGSGSTPLFAIECKKLTEQRAKGRWKQGVSQAILYSQLYKAVALILYDYTKDGRYTRALGSKRSAEAEFAESLREAFRIYVIALRPKR